MIEREVIAQKAQGFFEDLWKGGDYWDFESSDYEHARCQHLLRMLEGRHSVPPRSVGIPSALSRSAIA